MAQVKRVLPAGLSAQRRGIGQAPGIQTLVSSGSIARGDRGELANPGTDVGGAYIKLQAAKCRLHLRLDALQDGRAGRVRISACAQYRIEKRELEVSIVFVEATELRFQMAAEVGAFPANFVVSDVFRREHRTIEIDASAFVPGCYEGVGQILLIKGVIEIHLVCKPGVALLGIVEPLGRERKAEEEKFRNAARRELRLRITPTGLYSLTPRH